MNETLTRLVDLQRADDHIGSLRKKRDELDSGLTGARKALDATKTLLDAAHKELLEAKARSHRHELELKGRENEVEQLKVKLNTASSNKEYQSVLLRIGEITAENSRIEDSILLAMDEVEAKDKLHEASRAKVREAEQSMRAAEERISQQRGDLEQQLAEATARREELAKGVPAEALRIYERIRAGNKKSGTAVAAVHGEYCQACQMAITPQEMTLLVTGQKIVLCRTCQRILVLET